MRRVSTIVIAALACAVAAPADVIHLKNGHSIVADATHQKGDKLEYEIGDDSYAIPMSTVERVESGFSGDTGPSGLTSATASRPQQASSEVRRSLPNAASLFLEFTAAESEAMRSRLVHNGQLDREALRAIENLHNPHFSAVAYDVVASQAYSTGDAETAERYLQMALSTEPKQPLATAHYAAMLIGQHRYAEAVPWAEQATEIAPQDAGMWYLLGIAEFLSDHTPQAVDAWKHSLALRPTALVQQLLAKAQREQVVQAQYRSDDSAHFTLYYDGGQASAELRRQLLDTLEGEFNELSNQFGFEPRGVIAVIVYTNRAFTAVTQAPAWSDGMNDGKLRIPVQNMQSLSPEVAGVLRHELTHSFIGQITHDRCPQWLNEGIAQVVQGESSARYGALLRALYSKNRQIPLAALEMPFGGLSGAGANVAYAESVAAAETIRDAGTFSDLVRILQRIGSGMTTDQALRATIHTSYADLDGEIAARFGR
jgi:tetratricopeptide (TPR) repeat protein